MATFKVATLVFVILCIHNWSPVSAAHHEGVSYNQLLAGVDWEAGPETSWMMVYLQAAGDSSKSSLRISRFLERATGALVASFSSFQTIVPAIEVRISVLDITWMPNPVFDSVNHRVIIPAYDSFHELEHSMNESLGF